MTKLSLITPPEHLIFRWYQDWVDANVTWEVGKRFDRYDQLKYVATQAAQWGADQELEACCAWLDQSTVGMADLLRSARRPKPPSLKAKALHELNDVYNRDKIDDSTYDTIRRALEALDD